MVEPNRPKATIYAVAHHAGVSIATVSRAISRPDTVTSAKVERVNAAIRALDYVPSGAARSLAAKAHSAHGLVLPDLRGQYWADLIVGYEAAAGELGQSVVLVIAATKRDIAAAARDLVGRVDGITVAGASGLPTTSVSRLAQSLPVVVLAGQRTPGADLVRAEGANAAEQLTGRLIDHGRRDLAFVGDPALAVDVAERLDGFDRAHRARGLRAARPLSAVLEEEAGRAVARRILRRTRRPDGLVCANDQLALGVLDHFLDKGVDVPGAIAVTGWDDIHAAGLVRPRLTTVRQPVRELAALAARRLQDRIGGALPTEPPEPLACVPVIRESSGTATPAPRRPRHNPTKE
jgi:LacI family transcriptional regulator